MPGTVLEGGIFGHNAAPRADLDPGEVQVGTRRGGAALALVARTLGARTVGGLGGGRHLEKAQLADLHAGVQRNRHGGGVRELQGDVAGETRVDETRGGVRQQTQATQRGLSLQARGDVGR